MKAVLLLPLAAAACITPPALYPSHAHDRVIDKFPPGTECVDLAAADGSTLRGVFVPAAPGAPVVLHLLESSGSICRGATGMPVLWHLRDFGFASLCVDYRGVGASDGDRSPAHLRDDARVAYDEAVRRAGSESRVVLRASSIGTLAAASLLEDGAKPAAAVLVVPLLADTAALRHIEFYEGSFVAWAASLVLADLLDVDLVAAVRAAPCPVLAIQSRLDLLVDDAERAAIAAAAEASGGAAIAVEDDDHAIVVQHAWTLQRVEKDLLRRVLAGDCRCGTALLEHRVIDDPALARALCELRVDADPWREALILRWLRGLPRERLAGLPDDALRALLDFDDPAGPIDPAELDGYGSMVGFPAADGTYRYGTPEELAARAADYASNPGGLISIADPASDEPLRMGSYGEPGTPTPARMTLPHDEATRVMTRLLLKGAGIPDRVVTDENGALELEVFTGGRWRRLGP